MKHKLEIKNKVGVLGEKVALKYLKSNNFSILAQNYLEKTGEIDIIALKSNTIHFIEVKTRSVNLELKGFDLGNIVFSNVHPIKLKRMHRTIELYLLKNVSHETEWQIDIIGVYLDTNKKQAKISLIENVC